MDPIPASSNHETTSEGEKKQDEEGEDYENDSDYSSEEDVDDDWGLNASKVPYVLQKKDDGSSLNSSLNTMDTSATTNESQIDTDEEEDKDEEENVKEEKEDEEVATRKGKSENKDGETEDKEKEKEKRRKSYYLTKQIQAVQPMPKLKTLKKNRRLKIVQSPSAVNWRLPIYVTQPFPNAKQEEEKEKPKKRKREDPTRFILQLKTGFEDGACSLDECVFEDARGTPLSDFVARKFTIRKILRSLCKQLWNSSWYGVLTNARRRSLYESNTFEKKLRDRGASASLLGTVVEMLAANYALLDFVYIWFEDGTNETGLRLSENSFRVATETPKKLNLEFLPTMLHQQIQPVVQKILQKRANEAEAASSSSSSSSPMRPSSSTTSSSTSTTSTSSSRPPKTPAQPPNTTPPPPTTTHAAPQAAQASPAQMDSTMILARMLQDDRLRSRMYTDPSLLFDLCCSLGLEKRGDEARNINATPHDPLPTPTPTPTPPPPSTSTALITYPSSTPTSPPPPSASVTSPSPSSPIPPSSLSSPTPISAALPIVPIFASTPSSASAPPTPKIDSPPRSASADSQPPPKLTITLTPKSSLPPPSPSLDPFSPPATNDKATGPNSSTSPTPPPKVPGKRGRKRKEVKLAEAAAAATSASPVTPVSNATPATATTPSTPTTPATPSTPATPTSTAAIPSPASSSPATPTSTKRYHKRSKPTPPSSPPDPPQDEALNPVKQEGEVDDSVFRTPLFSSTVPRPTDTTTPNSENTSTEDTNATLHSPVSTNTNAGANPYAHLKFTVESIDLGRFEEEKITFVATAEDGKRKRLNLTTLEMKKTFSPEDVVHYMAEVEKFREGSGNSSYRSVMRRRGQN